MGEMFSVRSKLASWFVSVLSADAVPTAFLSVELKEEWAAPQSD